MGRSNIAVPRIWIQHPCQHRGPCAWWDEEPRAARQLSQCMFCATLTVFLAKLGLETQSLA